MRLSIFDRDFSACCFLEQGVFAVLFDVVVDGGGDLPGAVVAFDPFFEFVESGGVECGADFGVGYRIPRFYQNVPDDPDEVLLFFGGVPYVFVAAAGCVYLY